MITVSGHSDDLISVRGDITAEFDVYETAIDEVALVAISNGVVLRIEYRDCWRIELVHGEGVEIVPCPEGDEKNYSDVATIHGQVSWVVCGSKIAQRKRAS